jgi:hypothetical protein
MKDIRTLETTDGLYVNLSDIVGVIGKVCLTFPGFALYYVWNLLKEGIVEHEKAKR